MECTMNFDSHVFPPEIYDTIPSDFIRIPAYSMPSTTATDVAQQFSSFIALKILAKNVTVPIINCRRGDLPRCGTCKAYLSPFVVVNREYHSWRCPLCGHLNSTIMFTSIWDMTQKFDRPELQNLVYDILPPTNYCYINGKHRVFLFVVDEWLLSRKSKSYQIMIDQLEAVKKVIKKDDYIGLITYSSSVTLVDLNSSKSQSFMDFEPELFLKNDSFFVTAEIGFENLIKTIKSFGHTKEFQRTLTFTALEWACHVMRKFGGRLLLFSSGRVREDDETQAIRNSDAANVYSDINIFKTIRNRSISISLFKSSPIRQIENWAFNTGGIVCPFGQTSSLCGLFSVDSVWDCSMSFRTSTNVKNLAIYGNCSLLDNGVFVFPIATSEQSYIFELETIVPSIGSSDPLQQGGVNQDFHFQFALRFTDDNGMRKLRIINGKMPFTDIIRFPIDEAAISLFLMRKRFAESRELIFNSRVELSKNLLTPNTKLPQLIYGGTISDSPFLNDVTVERFAMSILKTTVDFGNDRKLSVVWTSSMIILFPQPTAQEMEAIANATHQMGISPMPFFSPKNESEFESMVDDDIEAKRWYSEVTGYIQK
ncbi:hypothetical protein TRFO_34504 [Tritrichomonas foetus]|uniref:Sec23/Sec24 trunk domain containing protein n=1 Tax=Tritrichomonas foetus TaxID=1144522 RepID=A0A1J4JIY4_9EUKA|nr:hypothetical protein TRFO_34504 [Tritrichomonas foetus]|eukprot:OHS99144.1 hypothetical protein TRFO_34504 [Tritrichomonas foetus]